MKLNGKQALAYCRIRHIDSDGARANRQKTVLNALLKKMKSSGTIDTVKTVNELAGYVYTGYNKKELISIGNTALRDGWLDYEMKTKNVPAVETCKGGSRFSVRKTFDMAFIPADVVRFLFRQSPSNPLPLRQRPYGRQRHNVARIRCGSVLGDQAHRFRRTKAVPFYRGIF